MSSCCRCFWIEANVCGEINLIGIGWRNKSETWRERELSKVHLCSQQSFFSWQVKKLWLTLAAERAEAEAEEEAEEEAEANRLTNGEMKWNENWIFEVAFDRL